MTNSTYLQTKKQRETYETQKGEIVFGLLGGTVLLLLGIFPNWPIRGVFGLIDIFCLAVIFTGLCFILLSIIVPAFLRLPYRAFLFISKKVGEVILLVLLTVIYLVLIIPVGLVMLKKRQSLGFLSWSGEYIYKKMAFEEIKTNGTMDIIKNTRFSLLRNIYKLFGTLFRNRRFFLIPTAIILVLVGLILFFAASNIIFNFFIYTLF